MVNYENSKVYKLVNTTTNQIYIGSTTRDLQTRYREHKSRYNCNKTKKENSILLFNDTDTIIIELLENVNCKNKKELHDREMYYIKSLDCVNKYVPTRTQEQYYQDNKLEIRKKNKEYYSIQENKDKKNNYMNEYRLREETKTRIKNYQQIEMVCECGTTIKKCKLARHLKTKKHIELMKNKI